MRPPPWSGRRSAARTHDGWGGRVGHGSAYAWRLRGRHHPGCAYLIAVHETDRELDPSWSWAVRFLLAGLVLVGHRAADAPGVSEGRSLTGAALYGTVGFAGFLGFMGLALREVPAGTVSVFFDAPDHVRAGYCPAPGTLPPAGTRGRPHRPRGRCSHLRRSADGQCPSERPAAGGSRNCLPGRVRGDR